MLSVLASGSLVADPVSRTSATGKTYATCSLRVPVDGDEAVLVSVIGFSEPVVLALLALAKGDAVSICGRAKLTSWEKDGAQRRGLSVTADRVLTAYGVAKQRKAARDPEEVAA